VSIEKALGLAQSSFRKDYGFRLVNWVFYEASFIESVNTSHGVVRNPPVPAQPRPLWRDGLYSAVTFEFP
jgi:hypothetical protein